MDKSHRLAARCHLAARNLRQLDVVWYREATVWVLIYLVTNSGIHEPRLSLRSEPAAIFGVLQGLHRFSSQAPMAGEYT